MSTDTTANERRWIVGFDGSETSKSAARWAATHADGRADSIRLLHAWSFATATVYSTFEPVALAETIQVAEHAARAELESFVAALAPVSPVPIDSMLVFGDAPSSLLDEARTSTQLVLGARGAGRFDRLLLGSTSAEVASHSHSPVRDPRDGSDRRHPRAVRSSARAGETHRGRVRRVGQRTCRHRLGVSVCCARFDGRPGRRLGVLTQPVLHRAHSLSGCSRPRPTPVR